MQGALTLGELLEKINLLLIFLQDRVTDHRIKKSWYNIQNIMAGNLDIIVDEIISR
ncbi:MAG: hypothetical protein HYW15_02840 [Candidatus Giovannonibacteria bacterium]|nr:MAG: hypothetical protein HYW15_02840 [Candidatus Giovannonibacteria bacterium]